MFAAIVFNPFQDPAHSTEAKTQGVSYEELFLACTFYSRNKGHSEQTKVMITTVTLLGPTCVLENHTKFGNIHWRGKKV
jgi:hypothetical protein